MSIVKFKVYLVEYAANKNIPEEYIPTQNFINNYKTYGNICF